METKRIVNVGVGGQGNLLASNLLGKAALDAGLPVMVSEIHGMAQRGGVVESAVILGEALSPIVSNGEADIVVGFEPVETLRALTKANKDTLVLTSTRPLPPFTVAIGQAAYPDVDRGPFAHKEKGQKTGGVRRAGAGGKGRQPAQPEHGHAGGLVRRGRAGHTHQIHQKDDPSAGQEEVHRLESGGL